MSSWRDSIRASSRPSGPVELVELDVGHRAVAASRLETDGRTPNRRTAVARASIIGQFASSARRSSSAGRVRGRRRLVADQVRGPGAAAGRQDQVGRPLGVVAELVEGPVRSPAAAGPAARPTGRMPRRGTRRSWAAGRPPARWPCSCRSRGGGPPGAARDRLPPPAARRLADHVEPVAPVGDRHRVEEPRGGAAAPTRRGPPVRRLRPSR